ncbi:TonB-dependent receptor [Membranihabitans marinus]
MREITFKTLDIIDVKGSVVDGSGEALIGVNVLVKGSALGTATDFNGEFVLSGVPEDAILVVSYIGYQTQEVAVANQTNIQIVLLEDRQTLDEIVVIGYGEQSRETLTSAVTKLDNKVIENTVYGDAASALQGTVSGVRVQTTSGQPGSSPRVIVRGGASINNPNGAEPLYVVDGVLRENLDGINTADIESMQVLKDAASTAIYGARAANGVVIVALKAGVAGQTRVNYKYSLGVSEVRETYDLMSAEDYIYFARLGIAAIGEKHPERLTLLNNSSAASTHNDLTKNTAFTPQYLSPENEYKLSEGWQSMADPLDPSKTIIFDDVDWQDVLFQTGITQDHYLSFSGGTEKATFNVGLGYADVQGVAIQTDYQRLTVNINGRLQVADNIYAFGGLNFSRVSDNSVYSENSIFERSIMLPQSTKYKYEDGTLAPGISGSLGNTEYHLSRLDNRNQSNQMTLSGGLSWEILPNLIFEPTASLFYRAIDNNSFQKSYYNGGNQYVDSRNTTGGFSKWDQSQLDAALSYNNSFAGKHNFQAKVGVSHFDRNNSSLTAVGRGAATDLLTTLNAAAEPVSVTGLASEQTIFGYFSRVTYNYDRKYLFALNARYDGASNLGDDNKWGFFPGVSAGWNVHNEDFWTDNSILSSLKVRASYGVNGNLGNLSDFQAQGQYSVGSTYDGVAAVEYSSIANQGLQWEQSKTLDFGFDAGILNNRVQLIFDYYDRITDNLITSLALPNSTGFSSILTNLGSLQNKGVELEVSTNLINKNDFSWDLAFNASYNKNKIIELPENDNENNRIGGFNLYDPGSGEYVWKGGLQEGQEIGQMYGYQFLYVYATDEEAAAGPYDELVAGADKTKYGGDVAWLDNDGNNIINPQDRVYMGNIYPKWTGGMSTTLTYKGLSLYGRMDYMTGHTIYNYVGAQTMGQFQGSVNLSNDLLRSWQNQGDVTDIPRYYWADQAAQSNYWRGDPRNLNNGGGSSMNYESGDYLALREITLTYDLPAEIYSKIGLSNLRFNITGNNIHYFTNYSGLAPEEGGIDRGRYPVPRVITFGLNATF